MTTIACITFIVCIILFSVVGLVVRAVQYGGRLGLHEISFKKGSIFQCYQDGSFGGSIKYLKRAIAKHLFMFR